MRELRNAACELASRGWHVIPLRAGSKFPVTKHGIHDATDDLATVLGWWQNPRTLVTHNHNIGVVCNPSGLVVIDIDPRHGGEDTFAELEKRLGRLPRTVEAESGGGGWHYYFKHPGGDLRGKLGDGVDLKDHGYVLAAPSLHPSGTRYEWSVDGHPDEVEPAELPDEWLDKMRIVTRLDRPARAADPLDSPDPLRRIPAAVYVGRITGRTPNEEGFYQCPFHRGGQERTPSLKCDAHMWACWGCEAPPGKVTMGGNIYDFMALTLDLPAPPRGADYLDTKDRLRRLFQ